MNHPDRVLSHTEKLDQVFRLKAAGIRAPISLRTSDGSAVRAFCKKHAVTGVIYKRLSGGGQAALLGDDDLSDERLALLRNAPALFQARIVGPEYRVYVVDGEVAGCAMLPTSGVVDVRDHLERAIATSAPDAVADACRGAARVLGLLYCACDVRVDDAGPIVLDVNSAPALRFYPEEVQQSVGAILAALLLRRRDVPPIDGGAHGQ